MENKTYIFLNFYQAVEIILANRLDTLTCVLDLFASLLCKGLFPICFIEIIV